MKKTIKSIILSLSIFSTALSLGCSITNPFNNNSKDTTKDSNKSSSTKNIDSKDISTSFYVSEISDDIFNKMYNKSYKSDCIIPRKDLRYLHVLHKTINDQSKEGELIVNYHIANIALNIFKELYNNNYPIEKIELIDNYDADDNKSMTANNSSCFNYRVVSNSKTLSKHAYGLAIDINPLYNPYVTKSNQILKVEPSIGKEYADRTKNFNYKIEPNDICVKTFKKYGFEWAGEWSYPKDYQHFEITNSKLSQWY